MFDNSRKFICAGRWKYSMDEKSTLEELVKKYKEEYDKQVESSATQINFNEKMRKHTKNSMWKIYCSGCRGYDDQKEGGGRKVTIRNVHKALFQWFADVQGILKSSMKNV